MSEVIAPTINRNANSEIPAEWAFVSVNTIAASVKNAIVGGPFGSDLVSKDYVPDGVPVIRGQNMGEHWLQEPYVFVTEEKAKALEANWARPGDVVFTQRGTLGQVSLVPRQKYERYLVSQSQMKVSLNDSLVSSRYFHYWFSSPQGQATISQSAIQTGVPHINLGILRGLPLLLPPLAEQLRIASSLSGIDALISSLDQLIAKKRDIQQAAIQQLLTGQRRLPGLTEKWEVKRLGEVLRVRHGRNQKEIESDGGAYPILATGGEIGRTDVPLYEKPSVLIGRKGTIDRPMYRDTPFWTVDTLFYTEINSRAVAKFIYYRFLMIDWYLYNEASGVPSLNAATIENIEIQLPSIAEQTAIATILSDMDTELAALEARRDKAHQLKQGMMQELLTGRIRLA